MAATFRIRLSPSGPFLEDASSGDPLEQGPGTPGLMWRAQGTAVTATAFAVAGVAVPGMSNLAWDIPPGYHYDVEFDMQLIGSTIADVVSAIIEYSEDNGVSWLPGGGNGIARTETFTQTDVADFVRFQEIDFDRTAPGTAPITNMRVMMFGPVTSNFQSAACALRVTQYVL